MASTMTKTFVKAEDILKYVNIWIGISHVSVPVVASCTCTCFL